MKECGAVIGGEGSGGVILPKAHLGRDAMVGIGLVLQHLTNSGGTVSELKKSMPQYFITKDKINIDKGKISDILKALSDRHGNSGKITREDGLKIDFPDSWVHLRSSNTEPIIRIIAEAHSTTQAQDLVHQFKQEILKQV